ncbi:unnamed protein product [Rotaria sordida]|uniref:Uncharacterized protein n=1 Tax=Rotaria sordida TaxID=392033 RepID=A0A814BIU5_9BILA|nr:unnamed protein product [Rotaria sordida]CAF0892112.1 unnamed protein product [Rotaria sordida]CAF0929006.1 unnamed protein product [Rotaria sordida]CAF3571288.1 unnamed protein product [Rotaria sordida]
MKLYIYIIVFVHIDLVFGIRCYSCIGEINKKQKPVDPCLNPAENVGDGNVNEIECLNTKLCWKGITAGKLRRGCGEKRCAFIPDISMGSFISQTCCSNDLCNRTSSIILSKSLVYFIIFLIFFYQLFY